MKTRFAIALIFFLVSISHATAQCAMCKAAAESALENDPNSFIRGLNSGILFLMVIPYLIVGVIFRVEIVQFFRNLFSKEKTPVNKKSLKKLSFFLTFITVSVILFAYFLFLYNRYH